MAGNVSEMGRGRGGGAITSLTSRAGITSLTSHVPSGGDHGAEPGGRRRLREARERGALKLEQGDEAGCGVAAAERLRGLDGLRQMPSRRSRGQAGAYPWAGARREVPVGLELR